MNIWKKEKNLLLPCGADAASPLRTYISVFNWEPFMGNFVNASGGGIVSIRTLLLPIVDIVEHFDL